MARHPAWVESRRQAIASGKPKEVCAYVVGKLADVDSLVATDLREINFHPTEGPFFFDVATGADVFRADVVVFTPDGKCYAEGAK